MPTSLRPDHLGRPAHVVPSEQLHRFANRRLWIHRHDVGRHDISESQHILFSRDRGSARVRVDARLITRVRRVHARRRRGFGVTLEGHSRRRASGFSRQRRRHSFHCRTRAVSPPAIERHAGRPTRCVSPVLTVEHSPLETTMITIRQELRRLWHTLVWRGGSNAHCSDLER